MTSRLGLLSLVVACLFGVGVVWADEPDEHHEAEHHDQPAAEEHHEDHAAPAAEEHHEDHAQPAAEHHEEHHEAAAEEHHEAAAEEHHEAAAEHADANDDADDDEAPTDAFDEDGDGVVEPDELETKKEFEAAFDDIPDAPDEAALDARPEDGELKPSLTVEQFRKLVGLARKVVLKKMEAKIAKGAAKKMRTFSWAIFGISLCGFGLLFMPLFLRKKYPGQDGTLFKYSALAALTFFVTINLFGGVLYGFRTVQGALSGYTNPSVAIAKGTFDTLDRNADDYITMGKELFAPTLEQKLS